MMDWLRFSNPISRSDLRAALDYAGLVGARDVTVEERVVPMREAKSYTIPAAVGQLRWRPRWRKGELLAMSSEERYAAVFDFRGRDWADRAMTWTPSSVPPLVAVRDGDDWELADGFGRMNYAIGMDWPEVPVAFVSTPTRRIL